MNRIPVLHYFKDKSSLINSYFIALVPLLIFGFYKNGILLYQNDLINFKSILIPIYFYGISAVVAFIVAKIMRISVKENILMSLIVVSTISINTNLFIYPILLFASLFIVQYVYNKSKLKFNIQAMTRILLIFSLLINNYSYLNIGEKLDKFNYDLFDAFLGFTTGGISSTSIIILIVSFIILAFNKYYKKIIPVMAILTFSICSLVIAFLTKDLGNLNILLNGTIYFSFIFVGADIELSPSTKKGMAVYGVLIGLLSAIIGIFNQFDAGFISIMLASLAIPIIERLNNKKYLQV